VCEFRAEMTARPWHSARLRLFGRGL